ncbi:nitroreductase family deazaflavin-dependent oxidoreductase [Actinomadura sp. 6K520]|jgi:deazaflavin-dependent oxidoreductase (nitroreductase family)|uniref:nitroreductase family deazaflavin-dependent oxidoreductase n=1 Tax=Actinomadura sp. 6K520 TaxID=2530364 RepID=UPI0010469FD2|nr:nitroreductase family deazaflavin-dependent oxidoreductase [Actinomadura sp. 6K520]TDE34069.1 nitroreductase family deazaflavin-dependent oxidoreductase [Actinomadura sp. 6K520]
MVKPLIPRAMRGFNKAVTNRIQGVYAPYVPPLAMVVHKGRRSGREYRTPVTAFRSGRTLVIGLPYGADTDWVRNLLAEGRGGVERLGRARRIARPRVLTADEARELPAAGRFAARYMDVLVADLED